MSDPLPKPTAPDFFTPAMAAAYDERNGQLAAISGNLHLLTRLILEYLPEDARVLCVGVGTGAEILSLAGARPGWTFVGVDPSAAMLAVCREKLSRAGLIGRCELIHGHVDRAPEGGAFDAVLSILVAHFVGLEDRAGFYRNIRDRLRPGGCFVSAEISYDLESAGFPLMLPNWERVQRLMGATPDSLRALPDMLRDTLCVLSPARTEALLRDAGFENPIQFFQAFLIHGWFASR
jgi:tRNA (cmo5U34)-methyltransferase